jgi:haloalkane dehalogenase
VDHRTYIDAFLEVMGIDEGVIVVGHEWGGALALDWANRHREAVRGVAYLETIVTPLTWYDWPESARSIFQALRTEAGDEMVLVKNLIVERLLPAGVIEPLPADVMAEYRRPYPDVGEERRPMLSWPRELPIDGDPEAVADVVGGYSAWLASSSIPKLFINGDPGWMLVGRQREVCRQWPNQTEVTVPGIHYLQEDAGGMIGTALAQWIKSL